MVNYLCRFIRGVLGVVGLTYLAEIYGYYMFEQRLPAAKWEFCIIWCCSSRASSRPRHHAPIRLPNPDRRTPRAQPNFTDPL